MRDLFILPPSAFRLRWAASPSTGPHRKQFDRTITQVNSDIERAALLMKDFPGRWGIAGGWAIDLFLQRESRPHSDIDVAVLRADQRHIRSRLPVDRAEKVVAHQLCPWLIDEDLQPPIHEIHATWP